MAINTTPATSGNTKVPIIRSHHVRTFFASIFGLVAVLLIFLSIIVVWLNQTLTNTTVFVRTVAPLATKPDIQDFITEKATEQLLDNAPLPDMAKTLLPTTNTTSVPNDELKDLLTPVLSKDVQQVVSAAPFAALWSSTTQSAHEQFIAQLNSNSPTLTLNFHPAVVGVINQLKATNLQSISDKITVQNNSGQLTIKGNSLEKIRSYYKDFKNATLGLVALTVVMAILCVVISVHHMKTLRRITFGVGVVALLLALALQAPALVSKSSDPIQTQATLTVVTTLLHNLQLSSLIVGIACLAAAIGSKIYGHLRHKTVPKVA